MYPWTQKNKPKSRARLIAEQDLEYGRKISGGIVFLRRVDPIFGGNAERLRVIAMLINVNDFFNAFIAALRFVDGIYLIIYYSSTHVPQYQLLIAFVTFFVFQVFKLEKFGNWITMIHYVFSVLTGFKKINTITDLNFSVSIRITHQQHRARLFDSRVSLESVAPTKNRGHDVVEKL